MIQWKLPLPLLSILYIYIFVTDKVYIGILQLYSFLVSLHIVVYTTLYLRLLVSSYCAVCYCALNVSYIVYCELIRVLFNGALY